MSAPDILTSNTKPLPIINLESLLDLSGKLNESNDEHFILNSSILSLIGKLKFLSACVLENREDALTPTIFKGKKPDFAELQLGQKQDFCSIESLAERAGFAYSFPVQYDKELFAVICLGSRFISEPLNYEELRYAELLSQITANAIQNSRSYKKLALERTKTERRNQLLTTIFEVTRDFSNLLSREQILKLLSYHLMGQLMVSKFAILIEREPNVFETLINRFEDAQVGNSISIKNLHLLASLLPSHESPKELIAAFPSTEVVSPMIVQGKTKGVLIVGKSMSGFAFDEMNLHFISAIGNTAMASIENERLFQEEIKKKAIESELLFALEIQKNLLPKSVPEMNGYSLLGKSSPSKLVGGDYFDYFKLPDGRLLLAIADVSGKGMPASLIMANFQAALRVLAPLGLDPIELMGKLNDLVYHNTSSDKFITFFLGILDMAASTLQYINAGHNPPFIVKSTGSEMLKLSKGGLILGCLEHSDDYEIGEVEIESGDLLCMYTDGITETTDDRGEEFGEERLYSLVRQSVALSPELIIEKIISSVNLYAHNNLQQDDLSLVILRKE